MLYANVALGLPVDEVFDYIVPATLENNIVIGSRVWVNFRNKREVAYVVSLSSKTKIKKIKEILALIDIAPILSEMVFLLTKRLAQYYCCSWGEAIETALPDDLRKGKEALKTGDASGFLKTPEASPSFTSFIQGNNRLPIYLREIKQTWEAKRSTIILFSDIASVNKAKDEIQKNLGIEVFVSYRKQPQELKSWEEIRQQDYCLVVGTRSSIFSPVNNLGLIIIDQEDDQVYKQEQVPHYHARVVALMRSEIESAKIILASNCLSLESYYLAQKNELPVEFISNQTAYPQVKVIDLRRLAYAQRKSKSIFSKFLADAIYSALSEKGKILLVVNRRGFATTAACHNCGLALKCPRCNINLVLHFEQEQLKCHHCNFKMEIPDICPSCKAGYIKYSGIGTEKVESELARIFPQAKPGQIRITTSSILKQQDVSFDLIGVLGIDNSLNRMDFRASEKTFALLTGLVGLTPKKIIIQSANAKHHCFQALIENDPQLFYKQELKQRKQLNFAPFKHMILLKVRGSNLEKVKFAADDLFKKLNQSRTSSIKMLSLNPGQPAKLRGNFYYQILIRAANMDKASHFLKLHLKEEHYSGIIITVDVDPV